MISNEKQIFPLQKGDSQNRKDQSQRANSLGETGTKLVSSTVFSYFNAPKTQRMNRFINFLTKKGKKSKAVCIFHKSLEKLVKILNPGPALHRQENSSITELSKDVFFIFDQAVENVKPLFEVKKVRIAGSTYQVPSLVKEKRQESLAMNWLLLSARERKKKNSILRFDECLAFEIYEAYKKQGQARMKRNELHKLAESNRAFSHYRWW